MVAAAHALGDPTISPTINYSPNVETNYSQNQSYYLKQGQGGGNVEDWYQYPTQTGEILFDVAGEGQQTLQALTPIGPPFITDLLFNGTSVLPYTWYDYPTLTGEVEFIDASGSHLLKSISGNLYYDNELLAKANDIQDIADWSLYPMINDILGNGFSIGGVLDVSASGIVQGGSLVAIGDISGATLHTGVAAVGSLEATGDISGASLHISGVAAVGSLEATGDISGSTLHVSGTATLHDIDLSGCALTTNGAGSALFVNGVEVQTGAAPVDASQWSLYPALQAVDVSGYAIDKATIINTSGLTIAGNTLIQGTLNTTGLITQDTVIGSPTENFLGNPLTIGTSVGIPPVDVTNGGLTVHGPTVLDGGTVHGCTIGSLPVLGINTVRVDVLPVGIDIVSATFVTVDAIGAVNLSAGLANQVSAGTYVSLQAATGTSAFSGVLVEAPFTQPCNLWFPYGGNIYGATDISSGTMQTGILTAGTAAAGLTKVVTQPSFTYYVSKNGRVGATGAITDPLSTVQAALALPAATGPTDAPGMTIFVAPGSYPDDIAINIAPATLPGVSIIGLGDDTDDSKRVQLRGAITINGTDPSLVNTVNVVVLANLSVFGKNATTSALAITGRGSRVYLKNGLYTTTFAASSPLISMSSLVTSGSGLSQLDIQNCSMSMAATATAAMIDASGGQIFGIKDTAMAHRGTGAVIQTSGGIFTEAIQSQFIGNTTVLNQVSGATAALTSLTNCLISGRCNAITPLINMGTNINLNINDCTVQNLNTTEVNNTSLYIRTNSATGNFISSIRTNYTSSTPAVTQITPFQSLTAPTSQLFYFSNIYTNATGTLSGNLPVQGGAGFNAVRQFGSDQYAQQIQVIATSVTAIALSPAVRGKTIILTGVVIQPFTTAQLGLADAGFFVIVHNGNASGGGDINMTGMTGTAIIHNRTALQNGGDVYLYWNGTGLVGY